MYKLDIGRISLATIHLTTRPSNYLEYTRLHLRHPEFPLDL